MNSFSFQNSYCCCLPILDLDSLPDYLHVSTSQLVEKYALQMSIILPNKMKNIKIHQLIFNINIVNIEKIFYHFINVTSIRECLKNFINLRIFIHIHSCSCSFYFFNLPFTNKLNEFQVENYNKLMN